MLRSSPAPARTLKVNFTTIKTVIGRDAAPPGKEEGGLGKELAAVRSTWFTGNAPPPSLASPTGEIYVGKVLRRRILASIAVSPSCRPSLALEFFFSAENALCTTSRVVYIKGCTARVHRW